MKAREISRYVQTYPIEQEGRKYNQEAVVIPIDIESKGRVKEIFLIVSNAYFKDGTGRSGFSFQKITTKKAEAEEALSKAPQGEIKIKNAPAVAKSFLASITPEYGKR